MQPPDIENLEIELLLEAIYKRYGYDFRDYAFASLKRRIKDFFKRSGAKRITEIIPNILYDKAFFQSFVYSISVPVTEMFRDPFVYQKIREIVIPFLKTYPFIRVWNAGCATGEEVYSIAILLKEEGLYERSQIYATDINDLVLEKAKEGIYSIENAKQYTSNYQKSGGKAAFSDYYFSQYNSIIIDQSLKKNIIFANHNLVSDSVFGEMHFILCRNVLIYFNKNLQERVLRLLYESLILGGFLCLGTKESLMFSELQEKFKEISKKESIYQKKMI